MKLLVLLLIAQIGFADQFECEGENFDIKFKIENSSFDDSFDIKLNFIDQNDGTELDEFKGYGILKNIINLDPDMMTELYKFNLFQSTSRVSSKLNVLQETTEYYNCNRVTCDKFPSYKTITTAKLLYLAKAYNFKCTSL